MNWKTVLIIVLVLSAMFVASGCIQTSSSTDNQFTTTQRTSTCDFGGCKTTSKECPFWDRDC